MLPYFENRIGFFFRAKYTEHFLKQVSIIAFYLKENSDGRLFFYFLTKMVKKTGNRMGGPCKKEEKDLKILLK